MKKLLTVAVHEYLSNVKRPSFLIGAFVAPVLFIGFMALIIALTVSTGKQMEDLVGVGYVDSSGILAPGITVAEYPDLFSAFTSEAAARTALDEAAVSAYFVLPPDYMTSGRIVLYSYENLPEDLDGIIHQFILNNLSADLDLIVPVERFVEPTNLTLRLEDSGRELDESALAGLVLFPLVFAVVFVLATQITSGFLMGGLVEEKSSRVIEILTTSVTPNQLLGGKIVGLSLLGLTQLAVWVVGGFIVTALGQELPAISGIKITLDLLLVGLIYFLLGYFLVASIMSAIGVLAGSEQESRQYAGFISLLLFIPYFFLLSFFTAPNGTVAVILSLIPVTAPMAMIIRYGVTSVPLWQLGLSLGLLLLSTLFFWWASARVFRWALLRYGQKLRLRDVLAVLRGRGELFFTTSRSTHEVNT